MFINLKNKIDFALRNLIKFSREGFHIEPESKEGLFDEATSLKEKEFLAKYELQALKDKSDRQNYAENLYTIDLLQTFLKPEFKDNMTALDIGSKNWFYVSAQYYFFKKFAKELQLDGIELDPWRVYNNLYSRYDAAMFYTFGLDGVNYVAGNFLEHKGTYDYIIWILPFITKNPLKMWGLPIDYFRPLDMLEKAYEDLNKGGTMLIVNQGEEEHQIQKEMFDDLQIPYENCGEFESEFLAYQNKRFVSLVKK